MGISRLIDSKAVDQRALVGAEGKRNKQKKELKRNDAKT
jgi:hypothetical protein